MEIINFYSKQIVANITDQMKSNEDGFDPRKIFMDATMNVSVRSVNLVDFNFLNPFRTFQSVKRQESMKKVTSSFP